MSYLWNPALETGHAQFDEQHHQLFKTLNNISSAFREGRGKEEIFKTAAFLAQYTVMHFTAEENLMKELDYPGYNEHKECHEEFKYTVSELTEKLKEEGPSEDLIVNITTAVGDWLIGHIREADKKMAAYCII
ncbi:MAG: hemerythrin family protein [Treponema sp.]|nr:hemerythrin family protein [Treponema sp.]